jgi:hypothetical protein
VLNTSLPNVDYEIASATTTIAVSTHRLPRKTIIVHTCSRLFHEVYWGYLGANDLTKKTKVTSRRCLVTYRSHIQYGSYLLDVASVNNQIPGRQRVSRDSQCGALRDRREG